MKNRIGGTLAVVIDGELYEHEGAFTYNTGRAKREALMNSQRPVGFKEMAQVPFFEGNVYVTSDLNLDALLNANGVTATLSLANGKTLVYRDAWFAGDGTGDTENGTLAVRFEAKSCDPT